MADPLDPFAYAERFNPRKNKPVEVEPFNPIADEARRQRENDIALDIALSPAPDQVARVTRVARQMGEPPALVEDRVEQAERGLNAKRIADLTTRYPAMGKFAERNPRALVAAQDDADALGLLGRAWDGVKNLAGMTPDGARNVWQRTKSAVADSVAGVRAMTDRVQDAVDYATYPITGAVQAYLDAVGIGQGVDPLAGIADRRRGREQLRSYAADQREQGRADNAYVDMVLQGYESVPLMLAAALTRNPTIMAGATAVPVGGNAFDEARARGLTINSAVNYALLQGSSEAVLERLPAIRLVEDIAGKAPIGKLVMRQLAVELPQEALTTEIQALSDWAYLNPEKSLGDYVAEFPDRQIATALGTVGGVGSTAAIVGATRRAADVVVAVTDRVQTAGRARQQAAAIDRIGKAAETSALRQRDPEAFAELVRDMAEDAGADRVFVPGAAVMEYLQSDAFDPDSDPFADYADQAAEAAAVGGDVVLPADFAFGALPGTPAWGALKEYMRFDSGGMSAREAADFDAAMDDVMAEIADSMAAEEAAQAQSMDVRSRLARSVQDKLQNAGFTPYVARQYAELLAQRAETRAARMGRELTGDEFGTTEIRQVLPPALEAARKADQVDLVINALRKGKPSGGKQRGLSLLEWIADRGGIEDKGGNIAAMGGDKWHREKRFRKKLLKPFVEAQGNMLGRRDDANTIERLFDAAISDGFFPDLYALRENGEGYADKIDVNDFLAAIGDELAGNPRYVEEAQPDPVRLAAEELAALLSERGIDPDGLNDAELRQVINLMRPMDDGPQDWLDQIPDTIVIDGVERPTRNSEGQPIAGTEEGVRAFYAWFGDSKVVDEEGRPLVVYHGTRSGEIESFDPEALGKNTGAASARLGFFFAGSEATSLSYVDRTLTESDRETSDGVVSGFDRIIADLAKWADENAPDFAKALRSTSVLLWHSSDDPGVAVQANSYDPSEVDSFGGYLDDVIREIDSAAFWEAELEGDLGSYVQSQIDRLQYLKDAYDNIDLNGTADEDAGSIVLQTYLKISDPFEVDQEGQAYRETSYFDLISRGKDAGSDGVIIRNTYDGGPKDDVFVAFTPTQIKSVNNRGTFDANDARILFQEDSLGRPLVVVHNLSADNFRNADELGGLAAPSIAVIRADIDWTNFGEISLIAPPDLVDPKKNRAAKGFNADVYSPRQPRAQFDLHGPTLKKLRADMVDAANELGESFDSDFDSYKLSREGLSAIEQSPIAKLAYLRSIGQGVKPVRDPKPDVDARLVKAAKGATGWQELMFSDSGFEQAVVEVEQDRIAELEREGADREMIRRIQLRTFEYDDAGVILGVTDSVLRDRARQAASVNQPAPINRWKTREAIDKKINATKKRPAEFRKWVQENYAGLIAGRFFETRDSGRRKPYTMDNLVREMTRTIRDGEGFNYGVGSLRSNVAKQFRSIKEMQDARDSILSDEAMQAIKDEVSNEMFALGEKFAPYHDSSQDFGWMDIFTLFLKDLSAGRISEWQQGIFKQPVPDALLTEAREFLGKLRDLPTEYFEIKMQRAVSFDEFVGAAVPSNAPVDVVQRLRELGLRVETYEAGGSRQEAIKRIAGLTPGRVLFQPAYHGSPHIFDAFSLDAIGTGEGAQAYGWGLYFAGRKEIAEHYRNSLSRKNVDDAELITVLRDGGVQGMRSALAQVAVSLDGRAAAQDHAAWTGEPLTEKMVQAFAKAIELREAAKGRLYQVEIPEDDEYLLWDAPLSEQPAKVKAALERLGLPTEDYARWTVKETSNGKFTAYNVWGEASGTFKTREAAERKAAEQTRAHNVLAGSVTYNRIADRFVDPRRGYGGDPRQASLALREAGVAGIKYLDGSSRKDGEGSYNYVLFDDSRVSITAYEQAMNDGPRGRIMFPAGGFGSGPTIIELFQSRNLSTLIHEVGHQWLEELRYDAEQPDAPEQVKRDWQTVRDWFAANNNPVVNGVIPTEAHEMWARGTERFIMEGKAPSTALQRLFETFRGWLVAIYKTVDALRSPITPEIREVMSRLIATDEEIQRAAEAQVMQPLFKEAAAVGMTGPEFDAYTSQVAEARGEAQGKLLAKTMAAIRARETKAWNEAKREVTAEVRADVNRRPLFRALDALKDTPVNRQWIIDEFGLDALDLLPKRVPPMHKDGGAHPTTVAELAGYANGRDMIEALIGAELAHRQAKEGGDQRTLRARTIETEVLAEMNRRYGDPLNDGTIEREALAVVANEKMGEVMASELRVLGRRTGRRATPYSIARQWARERVRRGTYAEEASPAAVQRHSRNVAKAGREAGKAILAGDLDEAMLARQRQMLSSALLAEAKAAYDEVEAARKRLDKIARKATSKSIDQDYLDQAHALLEAVDLRQRSQKSLDRQGRWAEWAAERQAEGFDIVVPPSFEATLGQTNWSRLPVETLLGLDVAVQQVIHLGRLKQTLLDNKERREFDALVQEAVDGAGRLRQKPPRDLMEPGWGDSIRASVAGLDASLLKMETVFDWLDGGNANGVFNRIVFRPIADAQGREQDMLADYYGRIKALFEAVPADTLRRWSDTVTLPFINRETGLPDNVSRKQVIAIALNTGNEGNLQRLTDGYGWNAAALTDWLDSELTADEWRFVQGVWDTIETLWPEIEAMEKRVNGVAPDKVEPREIVTRHGTFRGGYYPAIYDTSRDATAEEQAGRAADLFETVYTRATTRSGATKARAERVSRPILLDIGVINRHLGEVIHDITHREAVIQANKFLTDRRVMEAVDRALGIDVRRQFRPWVKFVANSWAMERAGNEGLGKFFGALRANATAVGMGFRISTAVMQVAGYANSIEVVGGKWMAEAIARSAANPVKSFEFVMERSAEVRHRMDTLDRDIRTSLAALDANPAKVAVARLNEVKRFMFHGIGYMDRVVSIPTWIAAYNKALASGAAEDDAVYQADKAVRLSQGAGNPKDMAAIVRGTGKWGELLKAFTMFYSYFSAYYQRQRTLVRDVRAASSRDLPKLAARAWWLVVVPSLLPELIKMAIGGAGGPDDDEWWAAWAFKKLLANSLGPIPIVRDLFEPAWDAAADNKSFGYSLSPLQRVGETYVNVSRDMGNIVEGEETKRATRNALEAIGYTTGLVPGQVAQAVQFMVDVGAGDARPDGLGDWWTGLTTGKLRAE